MSSNDLSRMLADLEVPGNVASEVAVVFVGNDILD